MMQTDSEAAKGFIHGSLTSDNRKDDESPLIKHRRQVAVCLVANCGMIHTGLAFGFASSLLPPLLGSGPGLHATVDQASWVAGLVYLSAAASSVFAGTLIDSVGRRWGFQILNLPLASGWLVMALFPLSMMSLYIGRVLTGLGIGFASCAAVTYTTEVTSPAIRTTLVSLTPVTMSFGIFLAYLGALIYQTSWTELSCFAFGLTVFNMLLLPLLPESPLWLLEKGREDEALEALRRLRGASLCTEVAEELESFADRAKEKKKTGTWRDTIHSLSRPEAYKPLIIMNVFFLFQHVCGVPIIIQYGVGFVQAAGIHAEAYYVALGVAVMRMFSTFLTSWACSKYGRRSPAIFCGVVMGASLIGLAVSPLLGLTSRVSGTLVLLYMLTSSVSFSAIPWSMLGEVFPTDVRGVSSGITVLMIYLGSFLATIVYPKVLLWVGPFGVFILFGLSGLAGTFFIYLCLPETHGKTLLEIKNLFRAKDQE